MKINKFAASFLCPVLALAPMAVSAQEATQEIALTLHAEPSYMVTIPGSVALSNEGATVDITASEVKNLPEGQSIHVTIEGTSAYRDQMLLEAETSPRTSLRYQVVTPAGEVIETNPVAGITAVGREIASFNADGTSSYQILPVVEGRYFSDVPYTGTIQFGIALY